MKLVAPKRKAAAPTSNRRARGGQSLGTPYGTLLEAAKLIEAGLPFGAISRFRRSSGFTLDRIKEAAGVSEGSFARRKQTGRLSPDESERLLRLSRVFEHALSLHEGDRDGAREWLETPLAVLGGQRPVDTARTEPGAREVEDLIGRIEHGIVS